MNKARFFLEKPVTAEKTDFQRLNQRHD